MTDEEQALRQIDLSSPTFRGFLALADDRLKGLRGQLETQGLDQAQTESIRAGIRAWREISELKAKIEKLPALNPAAVAAGKGL